MTKSILYIILIVYNYIFYIRYYLYLFKKYISNMNIFYEYYKI